MLFKKTDLTNSSTRHKIAIQKNLLSKSNLIIKNLRIGFKQFNGRSSNTGNITVWHKGGGCKKKFSKIEYNTRKFSGISITNMYDPFRTGFISLNFDFLTKKFFFTNSTDLVKPGSFVVSRDTLRTLNLGYKSSLKSVPPGSSVHDLTLKNDFYAKYSRSAGSSCQILQKIYDTCKVRLPSGIIISTKITSFATLGRVSNAIHNQTIVGKAGGSRLRGVRPTTRGRAMNAVDHPHGGQTNGGTTPVTPWGVPTRGKKTRKVKI